VTLHIGEIANEVEVVAAGAGPAEGAPPASAQPRWGDRERLRRVREALRRDEQRTATGERHG
jgi:hypothetical protein